MRSVSAVLWGILIALGVGALVVFGIVWPVFEFFFGAQIAPASSLPALIVVFASAFAFYWGGMIAAYKAPSRRRLHGVMVGVASFAISPIINLASSVLGSGGDPFANLRTPAALLFTGVLFVVVLAASYVGARRGETLFIENMRYIRARKRARESSGEASK